MKKTLFHLAKCVTYIVGTSTMTFWALDTAFPNPANPARFADAKTVEFEPFVVKDVVLNGTTVPFRFVQRPQGYVTWSWSDQDVKPCYPNGLAIGGRKRVAKAKVNGVECRLYGVLTDDGTAFEWDKYSQELKPVAGADDGRLNSDLPTRE